MAKLDFCKSDTPISASSIQDREFNSSLLLKNSAHKANTTCQHYRGDLAVHGPYESKRQKDALQPSFTNSRSNHTHDYCPHRSKVIRSLASSSQPATRIAKDGVYSVSHSRYSKNVGAFSQCSSLMNHRLHQKYKTLAGVMWDTFRFECRVAALTPYLPPTAVFVLLHQPQRRAVP